MTESSSAVPHERAEPRQRPTRIALWSALVGLHTLMLAASYWWVVVDGGWTDMSGRAFATCAFIGLMAVIANASSSLAHANETGILWRGSGSRDILTKTRALVWVCLEVTSLAMLSICAAILFYAVLNAG